MRICDPHLTIIKPLELYPFNPCDPRETVLVHKFEEVLGLAGITEFDEDFICVAVRLLSGRWRWLVSDFHKDSKANIN
jgi:hypothetical protein